MCSAFCPMCSVFGAMCSLFGRMCSLWRGMCSVFGGAPWLGSGHERKARFPIRQAQGRLFERLRAGSRLRGAALGVTAGRAESGRSARRRMCQLGRANVSSFLPNVSSFRPNVFTLAGNVSSFGRRACPSRFPPFGRLRTGLPRTEWGGPRLRAAWATGFSAACGGCPEEAG